MATSTHVGVRFRVGVSAGNRHVLQAGVRAALLVLGLLLPLNAPFSIPPVGDTTMLGWDTASAASEGGALPVVTHTMRHAYTRGLRPGDVILRINGEAADASTVARARGSALPGDTLELVVRRRGDEHVVRIPVAHNTAGYSGYFWYRVAVAVFAWAVGMALIAWRGGWLPALVYGAALLLLGPITLPSGVPANGPILGAAQVGWQLQAAAHRFFLPALLFHFVALNARRPALLSRPGFWWSVYLGLLLVLAAVTQGFRDPMAWGELGAARELRTGVGMLFEVLALISAAALLRGAGSFPRAVRWSAFAITIVMGAASVRSVALMLLGESRVPEFIWRLEGLAFVLLPATAVLLFAQDAATRQGRWQRQRRLASSVSLTLTALHGLAIAGTAAVVLSSTGRSLGGIEWLLFAAIFVASVFFSPVLRWGEDLVDRRMFARWAALEVRSHAFVDRVSAELQLERIAHRVANELPELLDVRTVRMVIAQEVAQEHGIEVAAEIVTLPRKEIQDAIRGDREAGHDAVVPISRPDGEIMGALFLGPRLGDRPVEPPERAALQTIARGIAAALRNAEAHLALLRAQRELAESERIASLGALAGGLAHEIKNPLASLKMGLHLLEQEGHGKERIRRITRDVQRIDDLVSGLLRLTQGGLPEERRQAVDIAMAMRACVADFRSLADDRRITIVERYPSEPALVHGGFNQIRLVLSNLLSNAIDFTGEGGTACIEVRALRDAVAVLIRDSGPGVPPDIRDRIFDLGYTTRPEGTGIGLALARREAERMGGTLELLAGAAQGTALRLTLPAANV